MLANVQKPKILFKEIIHFGHRKILYPPGPIPKIKYY